MRRPRVFSPWRYICRSLLFVAVFYFALLLLFRGAARLPPCAAQDLDHGSDARANAANHAAASLNWTVAMSSASTPKKRAILLSYPRSGNTATRVMIECLTRTPTRGYRATAPRGVAWDLFPDLDWANASTGPIFRKRHGSDGILERYSKRPLVFLVRDPRECIESQLRHEPLLYRFGSHSDAAAIATLASHARTFAAWPGPRLLLRYEQLVRAPSAYLTTLANFIGSSNERLQECSSRLPELLSFGERASTLVGGRTPLAAIEAELQHFRRQSYVIGGMPLDANRVPIPKDVFQILGQPYSYSACIESNDG